jgi:hypothetical protein
VRVLQLLVEHPLARVRQAVEECIDEYIIDAETVIQRTRRRAAIATRTWAAAPELPASSAAADVQVPLPERSRFDQLRGGHEDHAESHDESSIIKYKDTCITGAVGVFGTRPAAL